jgi:RNA-directed DNA polymerase
MRREFQVRFCEGGGVRLPSATRLVVLVAGDRQQAQEEKHQLAEYIRTQLRMELSEEKTLITDPRDGFDFLGYRIELAPALRDGKLVGKATIPKEATRRIRSKIRRLTRGGHSRSLKVLLSQLNPVLLGWRNYYRYAVGAWREFAALDNFVWHRVQRWLRRKYPRWTSHQIRRRYIARIRPTATTWHDAGTYLRKTTDGGTRRYPYRGVQIQNGWNDSATGKLAVFREVADVRQGAAILLEALDTEKVR